MGSADFAAQYQQEPIAAGGNLIKWHWFTPYDEPPRWEQGDKLIVSWDTAMSAGELCDYSACVVLQVRGETAYLLDVVRDRLELSGSATQGRSRCIVAGALSPATTRC